MWKKVKNILIIIGSSVAIVALSVIYVLMCGSKADRRRSSESDERDTAIKDGIAECEGRAEEIRGEAEECRESISRAGTSAERCEEHLQRAEDILREAIRRSREGKQDN